MMLNHANTRRKLLSIQPNLPNINVASKVASRELGGSRYIRRMHFSNPEEESVVHFVNEDVPLFSIRYSSAFGGGRSVATCDEAGFVYVIDHGYSFEGIKSDEYPKTRTSWQTHSNACFDIQWTDSDKKLLTAAADQTVCLWDIETRKCVKVCRGHEGSVKSVALRPYNPNQFASAGRDGHVMLWDDRAGLVTTLSDEPYLRPISQLRRIHVKGGSRANTASELKQSVSGLGFLACGNIAVTCGAADGLVKFWDVRRPTSSTQSPSPLYVVKHPGKRAHGYTSLEVDNVTHKVFVSCKDNSVYMIDGVNPLKAPVRSFTGAFIGSFYTKCSVGLDGEALICASADNNAYVWRVSEPSGTPCAVLSGHLREVNAVSWCNAALDVVSTCSDDGCVRFWKLGRKDPFQCGTVEDESEASPRNVTPRAPSSAGPAVVVTSALNRTHSASRIAAAGATPPRPTSTPSAHTPTSGQSVRRLLFSYQSSQGDDPNKELQSVLQNRRNIVRRYAPLKSSPRAWISKERKPSPPTQELQLRPEVRRITGTGPTLRARKVPTRRLFSPENSLEFRTPDRGNSAFGLASGSSSRRNRLKPSPFSRQPRCPPSATDSDLQTPLIASVLSDSSNIPAAPIPVRVGRKTTVKRTLSDVDVTESGVNEPLNVDMHASKRPKLRSTTRRKMSDYTPVEQSASLVPSAARRRRVSQTHGKLSEKDKVISKDEDHADGAIAARDDTNSGAGKQNKSRKRAKPKPKTVEQKPKQKRRQRQEPKSLPPMRSIKHYFQPL